MNWVRSIDGDRSFSQGDQVRRDDGNIFLFIEEYQSDILSAKAVKLQNISDDTILDIRADRFYKGACKRDGLNKEFKFEKVMLIM